MEHVFELSLVFIILSAVVGLIVKRLHRDKCLKDFAGYMVTVEEVGGKRIWGKLRVENTGLELVYTDKHKDSDGHVEGSYIIYEAEYSKMQALWRFHDELSEKGKLKRAAVLEKTYHPEGWRIMLRKTGNIFKTLRDAVVEIVNLFINRAKKTGTAGGVISSQEKHVAKMKSEMIGAAGTSYEPLLERYIGHKVVLEIAEGDTFVEYCGVLKDYTAEFIEIMDVSLKPAQGARQDEKVEPETRKADAVVLRKVGIVRHLGE
ncbi:MAG: hypothetical protein FVQ79_00965 [Planctomycetes bacterium]|nr:hypothetical protein [Planctomycetota bacterium]